VQIGKEAKNDPGVHTVGQNYKPKGKRNEKCRHAGDKKWNWIENMAYARSVGRGFFPLDEELELLPGILTPYGHEILVRLAGGMPFEKAAEMFEEFMQITVSQSLCQRYTEEAGALYEKMQDKEVEQLEKKMPSAPAGAEKMQISADGAMVPLIHGKWAEVRTLVIGEVQPACLEKGEWVVHTRKLSYFSRKITAQEFIRLALVETQRRGVENASQVAAVMDGADWEQGFIDHHCPNATRILDFPHAGEHISPIGEFLLGEGTSEMKQWTAQRLHQLKHEGPSELLNEIRELQKQNPDAQAISGNLAYLEKREQQMQYPQFQAQGWPIGSGIVESGNKLVVEVRLKGSGMHWADTHVNPMLVIRNIICSDRWKEDWPKIAILLCQQKSEKRHQLFLSRQNQDKPVPAPFITLPSTPLDPILLHKKDNPWKKFKFGHALYKRPDIAKK
jgi:hypothetical protein